MQSPTTQVLLFVLRVTVVYGFLYYNSRSPLLWNLPNHINNNTSTLSKSAPAVLFYSMNVGITIGTVAEDLQSNHFSSTSIDFHRRADVGNRPAFLLCPNRSPHKTPISLCATSHYRCAVNGGYQNM